MKNNLRYLYDELEESRRAPVDRVKRERGRALYELSSIVLDEMAANMDDDNYKRLEDLKEYLWDEVVQRDRGQ